MSSALFDFNSINVTASQYFGGGSGSLPLALLSRGDAVVSGTIDVSANSSYAPPVGGPGGGGGGSLGGIGSSFPGAGPGGGGGGLIPTPSGQPQLSSGGGGGGFGGPGGTGAAGAKSSNTFPGFIPLPGGAGGTVLRQPRGATPRRQRRRRRCLRERGSQRGSQTPTIPLPATIRIPCSFRPTVHYRGSQTPTIPLPATIRIPCSFRPTVHYLGPRRRV